MSVSTVTEGLVAVGKDSGITPLGHIVWWFIPDGDVNLAELRDKWVAAGLDPRPLPDMPRDVDLFRRAVRGEAGRKEAGDEITIETDVRDIPTNDSFVTYQVSRVVKDSANVIVEYPKALTVRYDRFTQEITFQYTPQDEVALEMVDSIKARYEASQKTITGNKVRALIREYLTNDWDESANIVGLSAESMRPSGGVYFVLHRWGAQIEALGRFVDDIYEGEDAAICSVPMADGASEREMVRRAHINNSIAEINKAITEGQELLRNDRKRAVTDATRQHHFQKLARLRRHAADYAAALQDEQEDVSARLALLGTQLDKLIAA